MKRRWHIFFILLFGSTLLAQSPHPYFKNFNSEHGLPSSEIHYVLEDNNGYIWLATDNGISRFDGYEFKNYGLQDGLKNVVVFYLQLAPDGVLWMATIYGQLFYLKGDTIYPFEYNNIIDRHSVTKNLLYDFYIDPSTGNKYVSIISNGILEFKQNGKFQLHKVEFNRSGYIIKALGEKLVIGSYSDPNETELINQGKKVIEKGYRKIEISSDRHIPIKGELKNKFNVSELSIKIFNDRDTIIIYDNIKYKIKNDSLHKIGNVGGIVHQKAVFKEKDGTVLYGRIKGTQGVARGGMTITSSIVDSLSKNNDFFLNEKMISHIFKDSHNGYWISTIKHGVFYTTDIHKKIFDTKSGLDDDYISSIAFKSENEIFIGLRYGTIYLLNTITNNLEQLEIPYIPQKYIINDLHYDEERKNLWIGTNQNALSAAIKLQSNNEKGFNLIWSYSKKIFESNNKNRLWHGNRGIISTIDLDNQNEHHKSKKSLLTGRIFCIKQRYNGQVLVGTDFGLFEFKNHEITSIPNTHPELNVRIEGIEELADSTLVIGTKGEGLLIWNKNRLKQLTKKDGLTSNMIQNLHIDQSGNIWVGTLQGLNIITKNGLDYEIKKFTTWHGLPSNEITKIRSIGEKVWVATSKGLLQWNLNSLQSVNVNPFIKEIFINNKPVDAEPFYNFSYRDNNLKVNYISLNYSRFGKIPYRFRLNDLEWTHTKNLFADFIDLSPGKYSFEVQSQHEHNVWSKSAKFQFRIKPPWWETIWFRLFVLFGISSILYLSYRIRTSRLQKEYNLKLSISELEQSALRAQMNPHFIFNTLNSIQKFILQNDQEKAIGYLSGFAKLTRQILKSTSEKKLLVELEIDMLKNYLNLEKLRFKNKFDFNIIIDKNIDLYNTYIQPNMVQPFIENAVIHGMKDKKSGGRIELRVSNLDESILIKIIDNGLGYHHTKNKKNTGLSVAISIAKKRLELANQNESLKIMELKSTNGEICGTQITLRLQKQ